MHGNRLYIVSLLKARGYYIMGNGVWHIFRWIAEEYDEKWANNLEKSGLISRCL